VPSIKLYADCVSLEPSVPSGDMEDDLAAAYRASIRYRYFFTVWPSRLHLFHPFRRSNHATSSALTSMRTSALPISRPPVTKIFTIHLLRLRSSGSSTKYGGHEHHLSISAVSAAERLPRCLGGSQAGTGTRN
jgi:hypothetical protein